jgi:hypothetical protein
VSTTDYSRFREYVLYELVDIQSIVRELAKDGIPLIVKEKQVRRFPPDARSCGIINQGQKVRPRASCIPVEAVDENDGAFYIRLGGIR